MLILTRRCVQQHKKRIICRQCSDYFLPTPALRILLQLLQPPQPRPRICMSLSEAHALGQTGCFFVLLPRFRDLALHLEELAEVVCCYCAADVALFVAIWRLDHGGLC
jgi:hypothetical protein